MMPEPGVRIERDESVVRLFFQRPQTLNALTLDVQQAVVDAADDLRADDAVRVVIVGGDGGTFSAGADLGLLEELHAAGDIDPAHADLGRQMVDAIESIPAVTIARIEGHCVGGGIVLAAACDLRIAAEDTYFAIPEVDLGIPLSWGAVPRLVREIGPARTLELVGTCRPFSAAEAAAMGFVNRVVSRRELVAVVDEMAALLAQKPDYALKAVTRSVRAAAEALAPALGMVSDAELLIEAGSHEEGAVAAAAYLERVKRSPP